MYVDEMNETLKLLDQYLSESLHSESPEKRALLKALAPMAIRGLYPAVMRGDSAGVAASRLLFEILGLIGKGQKSAPPTKDSAG
jgi:hypothetical protein